jgi:hypothetical protein
MIASKKTVHIHNMAETEAYLSGDPVAVASVEVAGARTGLAVPMLKDEDLIGAFTLGRQEVRDFSDREIALIISFASQAVIAIEHAQLLNELRQSLEQQTATAKALQVISSSTFDLQTVLDTLVETAGRLCCADASAIWRPEGDVLRIVSIHGDIAERFAAPCRCRHAFWRQALLQVVAVVLLGTNCLPHTTHLISSCSTCWR